MEILLFPERFISVIVEIDAADEIFPLFIHMPIRLHHRPEPGPQRQIIGIANGVFQLMPKFAFHGHPPLGKFQVKYTDAN